MYVPGVALLPCPLVHASPAWWSCLPGSVPCWAWHLDTAASLQRVNSLEERKRGFVRHEVFISKNKRFLFIQIHVEQLMQ